MGLLCILTVLPAALLMGASFPLAARLWAAGNSQLGSRLGGVYAANVAGAIVGSLAGGFLLVPNLGANNSLLLLVVINVAVGVWLLFEAYRGTARYPVWAGAAAALGLVSVLWAGGRTDVHRVVFNERHPDQELLWYEEGLESTVSVAREVTSNTLILYTNSLGQSSDAPDIVEHHSRIGHLGALLAPRLDRILVVGLGVGTTAGGAVHHTGANIEVVELSEAVIPGARYFAHTNANLLELPNVKLAIDDGRNHLLRARQPYDLIVADIIHPYNAGGGNLYSREYFQLAARALADDGIMVQWVPLEDQFTHKLIMRTFLEAFPHSTLWLATDVLVGAKQPMDWNTPRLQQRLADVKAQAALREVGLSSLAEMDKAYRADTRGVREYVGEGPILTDDRPLLEYFRSLDLPFGLGVR
jgi:spermidine synthase